MAETLFRVPLAMVLGLSLVLFAGWSPSALAAPREIVALHPLVVLGDDSGREGFQSLFAAEAARLDIELIDSGAVRALLESRPGRSCVGLELDSCLAELARASRASRTVFVSLSVEDFSLVLTGRLVGASGAVLSSVAKREFGKATANRSLTEAARFALHSVLNELEPSAPELAPLAAESPSRIAPQSGSEAGFSSSGRLDVEGQAVSTSVVPPLRWASYGLFAGSGASVIAATVVALSAKSESDALRPRLDVNSHLDASDLEGQALQRSLAAKEGWATGLLVGAGVSAVAGGVLYYLSGEQVGEKAPVRVSLVGSSVVLFGTY